jgi:thymidylate synthase (FAD)
LDVLYDDAKGRCPMILVKPAFEILACTDEPLKLVELAGRTCYKSEDKITDGSADKFVEMVANRGHLSVIEPAAMTVKFTIDRGVSHELVRHRLAAYSQESTRYADYSKGKFGSQVTFVIPPWVGIEPGEYSLGESVAKQNLDVGGLAWIGALASCETAYLSLIQSGWRPEQARSVLPNSLKTEIVATMNFRQWLHVFDLRCSPAAHPQMREIMVPLRDECRRRWPAVFGKP